MIGDNLLKVLRAAEDGTLDELRKDVFRDEFDGLVIDTCDTADCGWETGIERDDGGFVIVEEYPNREAAKRGHAEWVRKCKDNPKLELTECRDVVEWFFE